MTFTCGYLLNLSWLFSSIVSYRPLFSIDAIKYTSLVIWYDTISNISSQLPKSKIFCILGGRLLNAASAGAKTVYGPAMAIKKIKPQYYV